MLIRYACRSQTDTTTNDVTFRRLVALYRDIIVVGQDGALRATNGIGRTILRREVVLYMPRYMITIASVHVVV
jgi:hypothetical protein